MKKKLANLIYALSFMILGGIIFYLGTMYGETSTDNPQNLNFSEDLINDKLVFLENNLNKLKKEVNEKSTFNSSSSIQPTPEMVGGGGWITGVWEGHPTIGGGCWSWGDARCVKSEISYRHREELKCPQNYGPILTGFYSQSPISSENRDTIFICVRL